MRRFRRRRSERAARPPHLVLVCALRGASASVRSAIPRHSGNRVNRVHETHVRHRHGCFVAWQTRKHSAFWSESFHYFVLFLLLLAFERF